MGETLTVSKRSRKPYTITKPREAWSKEEHQKFLDALKLYERDWKNIGQHVTSKSIIQIRSHAQKYFLKMQKMGRFDMIPPPRPKRKAKKPYPRNKRGEVIPPPPPELILKKRILQRPDQTYPVPTFFGLDKAPGMISNSAQRQLLEQRQLENLQQEQLSKARHYLQQSIASHVAQLQHHETTATPPSSTSTLSDRSQGASSSTTNTTTTTTETGEENEIILNGNGNEVIRKQHPLAKEEFNLELSKDIFDFNKLYQFLGRLFDPNSTGYLEELEKLTQTEQEIIELLITNLAYNVADGNPTPLPSSTSTVSSSPDSSPPLVPMPAFASSLRSSSLPLTSPLLLEEKNTLLGPHPCDIYGGGAFSTMPMKFTPNLPLASSILPSHHHSHDSSASNIKMDISSTSSMLSSSQLSENHIQTTNSKDALVSILDSKGGNNPPCTKQIQEGLEQSSSSCLTCSSSSLTCSPSCPSLSSSQSSLSNAIVSDSSSSSLSPTTSLSSSSLNSLNSSSSASSSFSSSFGSLSIAIPPPQPRVSLSASSSSLHSSLHFNPNGYLPTLPRHHQPPPSLTSTSTSTSSSLFPFGTSPMASHLSLSHQSTFPQHTLPSLSPVSSFFVDMSPNSSLSPSGLVGGVMESPHGGSGTGFRSSPMSSMYNTLLPQYSGSISPSLANQFPSPMPLPLHSPVNLSPFSPLSSLNYNNHLSLMPRPPPFGSPVSFDPLLSPLSSYTSLPMTLGHHPSSCRF